MVRRYVTFMLVVLAVSLGCSSGVEPGTRAPDFTIRNTFTGEEISLSSLYGRPVILYFFASW